MKMSPLSQFEEFGLKIWHGSAMIDMQGWDVHVFIVSTIYTTISLKELINRTCQWVSVVNVTHILQCARAHDCIGYL